MQPSDVHLKERQTKGQLRDSMRISAKNSQYGRSSFGDEHSLLQPVTRTSDALTDMGRQSRKRHPKAAGRARRMGNRTENQPISVVEDPSDLQSYNLIDAQI